MGAVCVTFVEHFWSVSWDLREQEPYRSTVITFPSGHDFGRVDSPHGSAATPRA